MHPQFMISPGGATPGRRELSRLRNREALISAAAEIFLSKGYEATTVRDIVAATNLALGTFYNYFADKQALLRVIIGEHVGRVALSVREFRRKATNQDEFVRFSYEAYFRGLVADPVSFALASRPEASIATLTEVPLCQEALRQLIEDIDDAKARGWLPAADSEYIAAALLGVGHEVSRIMISRRPVDPGYAARFAAALFSAGLSALPRH